MADIEWVDADGVTTVLSADDSRMVEWNVSGLLSPPVRFEEEGIPEMDGARLRAVHHSVREVFIPVWVHGTSAADLRTKVRQLVSALNPLRGDGRLRVTSPIGDQRELVCRVSSGLEGVERLGETSGIWSQSMPLLFRVWDPYWQDVSDTVSGPWNTGGNPGSFFPLFPLRLSSSEVFASVTVDNAGDVEAWPVWTLTGPGASPKLKNLTTGKTLDLSAYSIASGEVVTIDTRPTGSTRKTITSSVNGNLYPYLTATSALWPFALGSNTVQVEMGSASDVSSVQVSRRHRWLAA